MKLKKKLREQYFNEILALVQKQIIEDDGF